MLKIGKTSVSFMALAACLFIAGLLSFHGTAKAADEGDQRWFFVDIGLWGGYYGGPNEEYYQLKGSADTIFQLTMVEAVAGYTRYQHYQVTDGNGNYGYADLNQIKAGVTVSPGEMFTLTAGYRYYVGTRDYAAHQVNGGVNIALGSFSIGATLQWKMEEYEFLRISYENYYLDAAASAGYDFSERTGIEAEFTHSREDFEGSLLYYSNLLRLGVYHYPLENFMVGAGIIGGGDSADYIIIGGELSLGWIPMEGLSVNFYGSYSYYAFQGDESTSKTKVNRSKKSSSSTDPSLAGESYGSWGFGLGVTYRI